MVAHYQKEIVHSTRGRLCELSFEAGRQIAVTIDRRARIRHVIVGDADGIFIPTWVVLVLVKVDFRGIHLIHTNFRNEPLTDEDLTDLIRLRFDMMIGLGVTENGRPGSMYHTHLLPFGSDRPTAPQTETTPYEDTLDFIEFITSA